jgi:acetyl esterase/lipase
VDLLAAVGASTSAATRNAAGTGIGATPAGNCVAAAWLSGDVTQPFLQPFVLEVSDVDRVRQGSIDVYGDTGERRPAVVFVHGGPLPPQLRPAPRDWPVFVGYASLAAATGLVGVTVDHRLHSPVDYPTAADDVAAAVEQTRQLPGVDPDRVALWFFSGGGMLSAPWLSSPPPWLRCVALTYPVLAPVAGWDVDPRFRPAEAVGGSSVPVLLTRAGLERPDVAATVEEFLAAAPGTELVDVPHGRHSFDMLDHTDESRAAVDRAMSWVAKALRS